MFKSEAHESAFVKIAVAFAVRDGYSKDFAVEEVDRFMNLDDVMAEAGPSHPYVKASRVGSIYPMNRMEKIALVTLFQNALKHSYYEVI